MAEEFINGYHVFALCLGKDPFEDLAFEEFENSLGAGAYASVLVGRNTGEKSWRVSWPRIAGASGQANVEYRGAMLTPADYLWALYCDYKVEGKPFVVKSPRNGQYYLARFAQKGLSYQRMITMLFATGVELRQCYIDGVSVYDPTKLKGIYGNYVAANAIPYSYIWPSTVGTANEFGIEGEIGQIPNVQNGKTIMRFNESPEVNYVRMPSTTISLYDALFVVKFREDLFTGFQGLLSASTGLTLLVGNNGDNRFVNYNFGQGCQYRLNGVELPQNDQRAPMNRFAVVHIHFDQPIVVNNPQVGRQENLERYAKLDLGEFTLFTQANPMNDLLELTQHLITDWDL
jgi:hypothetical protein